MFNIVDFNPREYQLSILETCKNNNTLVVLPTGTGKTALALLLGLGRLNKFENSKILILSPSKPLSNQHCETFKKHTNIEHDKILLLTGLINASKRSELWKNVVVIVATPQTIQKDLENNRINLKDFSLLVIDEAHHSRENFANTHVTRYYFEHALNPRILALTASPGGTSEKIKGIMKNLNLDAVEIRSEQDEELRKIMPKREVEWIEVHLPEELKNLHSKIKDIYLNKAKDLIKLGFNKPVNLIGKKDLLALQQSLRNNLNKGDKSAYYGISLTAQLIKIDYMLELLEIEGLKILSNFFEKLKQDQSKAAKNILNNKEMQGIIKITNELINQGKEHPKFDKLREIVLEEIKLNNNIKIIVFANYRDTVEEILKLLRKNNIKCKRVVGQKLGLTQREQINTLREFEENDDNVLVGTQIIEEGISLSGLDMAIFFESTASELRKVQRSGRVARVKTGKIIFLITKNTRDEAYFWSGYQKEKKMKKILYELKEKGLQDFFNED